MVVSIAAGESSSGVREQLVVQVESLIPLLEAETADRRHATEDRRVDDVFRHPAEIEPRDKRVLKITDRLGQHEPR